ncbi:AAA family ATPase [Paenibacillus thiaminolyticus]|uniref:AAA family ATPase n=1 Tax=Paenibacillus thiaminolyticus TaxID=49283 RepID=UPI00232FA8B8|nr:AAA family ATPase [Paenibacillus thiaminolyticus]WCF09057.1 AAA family ATPase [Paenibacillus thiaminolyticus]
MDNLSVKFSAGVINVIVGKNGSGKTTLFDLITNVIKRPNAIQGVPNDKEIIYQLQGLLFPSILKGKDVFRFFLHSDYKNKIKLLDEPYIDEFMSPSEKELMEHVWNTRFGHLSVGERRYLCILATTLMKRKLYLFDEPTSGVDPEARIHILKRIEKLLTSDTLVLLSTHTLHEFEDINCKIHLLHQGRMKFQGSYADFVESTQNHNPDIAFYKNVQ